MPRENARLFGPQHWNAIAKDIRIELQQLTAELSSYELADPRRISVRRMRRALEDLALRFAARFKIDNDLFDPIDFLEKCSPDNVAFPIAELWEEHATEH